MSEPHDEDSGSEFEVPDVPLQHLRPFGAGLKRNRITFVPASAPSASTTSTASLAAPSTSISDYYIAVVLPLQETTNADKRDVCPECHTEKGVGHETSIAHQVSLPHSVPPHSLDRNRQGFKYLESYGWDADARQGLGVWGEGIKVPIKLPFKLDTLGIGARIPKGKFVKVKKKEILGAKEVRKRVAADKKKAESLQRHFWGNSDVEKYLGTET